MTHGRSWRDAGQWPDITDIVATSRNLPGIAGQAVALDEGEAITVTRFQTRRRLFRLPFWRLRRSWSPICCLSNRLPISQHQERCQKSPRQSQSNHFEFTHVRILVFDCGAPDHGAIDPFDTPGTQVKSHEKTRRPCEPPGLICTLQMSLEGHLIADQGGDGGLAAIGLPTDAH